MSVKPVVLEADDAIEIAELLRFVAEVSKTCHLGCGHFRCLLSDSVAAHYDTDHLRADAVRLASLIEEAGSR